MREMKEVLKRVGVLALSVMLAVGSSNLTTIAAETGANAAATGQTAAPAEPAAEPAATEPAAQEPAAAPETPSAEQPARADESMETAALDTSAENTETPAEDAVVTTEAPEKGWNPV